MSLIRDKNLLLKLVGGFAVVLACLAASPHPIGAVKDAVQKRGAFVITVAGSGLATSIDGIGRSASFSGAFEAAYLPARGSIYVTEPTAGVIRVISGDFVVKTLPRGAHMPTSIAYASDGFIYVVDLQAGQVVRIESNGLATPFFSFNQNAFPPITPASISDDSRAGLVVADNRGGTLINIDPHGTEILPARPIGPGVTSALATRSHHIYFANQMTGALEELGVEGPPVTLADRGIAEVRQMTYVSCTDSLYLADVKQNKILRFDLLKRKLSAFAGSGIAGETDGPVREARFNAPTGITYDSKRHALIVVDSGANRIRAIYNIGC